MRALCDTCHAADGRTVYVLERSRVNWKDVKYSHKWSVRTSKASVLEVILDNFQVQVSIFNKTRRTNHLLYFKSGD